MGDGFLPFSAPQIYETKDKLYKENQDFLEKRIWCIVDSVILEILECL